MLKQNQIYCNLAITKGLLGQIKWESIMSSVTTYKLIFGFNTNDTEMTNLNLIMDDFNDFFDDIEDFNFMKNEENELNFDRKLVLEDMSSDEEDIIDDIIDERDSISITIGIEADDEIEIVQNKCSKLSSC